MAPFFVTTICLAFPMLSSMIDALNPAGNFNPAFSACLSDLFSLKLSLKESATNTATNSTEPKKYLFKRFFFTKIHLHKKTKKLKLVDVRIAVSFSDFSIQNFD